MIANSNEKRLALETKRQELSKLISEKLFDFRKNMCWTRKDLAAVLPDITAVGIQRWETQTAIPLGVNMVRIARLLDIDLSGYPSGLYRMTVGSLTKRKVKIEGAQPIIDISALLRVARSQQGLSTPMFANQLGVPLTSYNNWEKGRNIPTGPSAQIVADFLKLPLSAIGVI